MELEKYSFGLGDRFGRQGQAQLRAIMKGLEKGVNITPVWNKSHREHGIVGTSPENVRQEAEAAVRELGWKGDYWVDADHINLGNVQGYIDSSDFFTIDVADQISAPADTLHKGSFIKRNSKYKGQLDIPGIGKSYEVTDDLLSEIADKYLNAARKAGEIYRYIAKYKGSGEMIPEVSMDEVVAPQTPIELFFILSALSDENIPLQTIAPKFSGRFNKGVDYTGTIDQFEKEFEEDLMIIDFAVKEFGLPANLKLSVHSGSDKFSIYPVIGNLIRKHDKGIHVKTAGTTWLEEVIGLAAAGSEGLALAKELYHQAYNRRVSLCEPYATVIDIDPDCLPVPEDVESWGSAKYTDTLRHIPGHADYNPHFRQLIHVGYKVAAEMDKKYYDALEKFADIIGENVEQNIFERHLQRLFDF